MLDVENGPSLHKIYLFLLLKPRRFRKSKQVHKREKIDRVHIKFICFYYLNRVDFVKASKCTKEIK